MTVVVPCDAVQTKKATIAHSERWVPAKLPFGREKTADITKDDTPYENGHAQRYRQGGDVAIVAARDAIVYTAAGRGRSTCA